MIYSKNLAEASL